MKNKLTGILVVKNKVKLISLFFSTTILSVTFVFGAQANDFQLTKTATEKTVGKFSTKLLAPFIFHIDNSPRHETSLKEQKTATICLDMLAYLNHPRTNDLFKPDGTLVREGERIKSVTWENLDKGQYREVFINLVNGQHPNIQEQYLKWYADPEWVLQRTLAHPKEHMPKLNSPKHWLYRLVSLKPYPRNRSDPTSKIELPTWFPNDSLEWLGDVQGNRHVNDKRDYGARQQWIIHTATGLMYAIENSTYGGGKGARPKYLEIDMHALILNSQGQSFPWHTCALRARNHD